MRIDKGLKEFTSMFVKISSDFKKFLIDKKV